jgi:hypothetical protein
MLSSLPQGGTSVRVSVGGSRHVCVSTLPPPPAGRAMTHPAVSVNHAHAQRRQRTYSNRSPHSRDEGRQNRLPPTPAPLKLLTALNRCVAGPDCVADIQAASNEGISAPGRKVAQSPRHGLRINSEVARGADDRHQREDEYHHQASQRLIHTRCGYCAILDPVDKPSADPPR